MKNYWVLMLLWFVFTTQDKNDAVGFLNKLGNFARTAKVFETQSNGTVTVDIYYEAAAPIPDKPQGVSQ